MDKKLGPNRQTHEHTLAPSVTSRSTQTEPTIEFQSGLCALIISPTFKSVVQTIYSKLDENQVDKIRQAVLHTIEHDLGKLTTLLKGQKIPNTLIKKIGLIKKLVTEGDKNYRDFEKNKNELITEIDSYETPQKNLNRIYTLIESMFGKRINKLDLTSNEDTDEFKLKLLFIYAAGDANDDLVHLLLRHVNFDQKTLKEAIYEVPVENPALIQLLLQKLEQAGGTLLSHLESAEKDFADPAIFQKAASECEEGDLENARQFIQILRDYYRKDATEEKS
ncbi:MAG: hypothetical protein COT85_07990 [Chlamydiae bacterium CG10_big_fil_rev_8_21_14_0_10_42_34]|nr:MAG: hypothetical protein COT85_07990 [Chlamydiae bacterium CG10_big_fil_rev_8_21_14_0_10_42_34]